MFKWSWVFEDGSEPPVAPVRVDFPKLRNGFCNQSYLKSIAAPLRKLLAIDLPTLAHASIMQECVLNLILLSLDLIMY